MLTSKQIAKELITRKTTPQTERSITTTSFEMINPDPDIEVSDDSPRRHFWGLPPLRRKPQQSASQKHEDESDGRRVVSEPVMSGRRGMSVLRRFKFGRQDIELEEDEGDLTISTETDVSIEPMEEEESKLSSLRNRSYTRSIDSSPSFISFVPTTPSTTAPSGSASPRSRYRHRPRNLTLQSVSVISEESPLGQLAPRLDPASDTPARGKAIRVITTEARLANTSTSTEASESVEYPSYVDTSSSFGGILRARHNRAPNNTPVQNVRFLDSPRTEYLRRKARERLDDHPAMLANTPEPLPPAQITQSSRWARLGNILNVMEDDNPGQATVTSLSTSPRTPSFAEPVTPDHTRARYRNRTHVSSSDSPISFTRFDPPVPICSTPLWKHRHPKCTPSNQTFDCRSLSMLIPSPLSGSDSSVVSSPAFTRRFADEDEVVEVCTALEALWEYGSSEEDAGELEMECVNPLEGCVGEDEGRSHQESSEMSRENRGSTELLPLKFKGQPKDINEEPFPFASTLRF